MDSWHCKNDALTALDAKSSNWERVPTGCAAEKGVSILAGDRLTDTDLRGVFAHTKALNGLDSGRDIRVVSVETEHDQG